eukprot:m.151905 g.151905  ORF g.151905 m.151905 type:complete len:80 (-) comp52841_c0_seq1:242-481(-)
MEVAMVWRYSLAAVSGDEQAASIIRSLLQQHATPQSCFLQPPRDPLSVDSYVLKATCQLPGSHSAFPELHSVVLACWKL